MVSQVSPGQRAAEDIRGHMGVTQWCLQPLESPRQAQSPTPTPLGIQEADSRWRGRCRQLQVL